MGKREPKPLSDRTVILLNTLFNRKLNELSRTNALGGYDEREAEAGRFMRLIAVLYRGGGLCDEDLETAVTLPIDQGERLLKYRTARRIHNEEFEQLDPQTQEAWKKL